MLGDGGGVVDVGGDAVREAEITVSKKRVFFATVIIQNFVKCLGTGM